MSNIKWKILWNLCYARTYQNLEVIFLDDGSTDQTAECIMHYKTRLEQCGMSVNYIYQANTGLGGAINHGLKQIHGQFLAWPDPDDWLSDDSIERRLGILLEHPEYGVVTSNAYIYEEHNLVKPIGKVVTDATEETVAESQFELLLRYRSIFCSGCHLMRVSALQDVNPKLDIFEARRGQNFQLLLPVYYKYKRYFLDECLYHYVIYADSMSHGDDTLVKEMLREDELLEILLEPLVRIKMPEKEREKYVQIVREDDARNRFRKAYIYIYGDKELLHRMYKILKRQQATDRRLTAMNMIGGFAPLRRCSIFINQFKKRLPRKNKR